MDKIYDHKTKEPEMYKLWESIDAFSPEGASKLRKPLIGKQYTVLMPPPNANASLHCGHVTYSIQDLMIRFKRMQGFDALYLPGMDHAGFETQVVYERQLKKQGKSRFDFDRETLYKDILDFVLKNSDVATSQLKRIGMSADWSRSTFMLDNKVINTVYDTFQKMYKDGMVYRSGYMVNYSTFHGTTFSDLETLHKESISPLYYVKYQIENDKNVFITVATVRPETIYADVAIAINPKDNRYIKYVGKNVINPLTKKLIPIIQDEYVDIEFGTGALKITPGHDHNDFAIGKKHGLEVISLISFDGKFNENAKECEGLFAKQARIKSVELLKGKDALEKVDENYKNNVLVDYKDELPIEPMVIPNWFIDTDKLCDLAISAVEKNEVKFYKSLWKKEILRWLKEKKPWPISRQTVFGIRIPVWYNIKENPDILVVFLNKNKDYINGKVSDLLNEYDIREITSGLQKVLAAENAKFVVSVDSPGELFLPETDTFDTWFSSGQWPLTTTDYPSKDVYKKYFPTDFLDSMWDIIFFWIARMIMFSKYLTGKVPFKNVYVHAAITDKFGKKMSKSVGNVINPLDFVDKYGADALRMGLLVGGDTSSKNSPLDEDKVRGYRNFANKMWNIARFIEMKSEGTNVPEYKDLKDKLNKEDLVFVDKYKKLVKEVTLLFDKYKYKVAGEEIYDFIWNEIASSYLEKNKDRTDMIFISILNYVFLNSLKLLHPIMPFVTEAIWQNLNKSKEKYIITSSWPEV